MLNFLGFEISFQTMGLISGIWFICLCLWFFNLNKKDISKNDISEKISTNEAINYKVSKSKQTKYGKFYKENLSGFFSENSLLYKLSQILVPEPLIVERKLKLVDSEMSTEEFISIKSLTFVGGTLILLISLIFNLGSIVLLIGGALLGISFAFGDIVFGDKIKKRKIEIERNLPNFLDLLYSACRSGHTITEGIRKVSSKYSGLVSEEFNKAMIEYEGNGGNFKEALNSLAERNDIDSLSNVLSDILISYEKGDDAIIETLKQEAVSMRDIVNSEVEEQANKKSTTLLLPMMIFFFVPILMLVLIPLVSQFMSVMGS